MQLKSLVSSIGKVTLAIIVSGSAAVAESTVEKVRDWNLVVETDAWLNTTVCRAYTQVAKSPIGSESDVGLELSLSFAQDSSRWPIYLLKVPAQVSKASLALLRVNSRESHPMFLLKAGAGPLDQDVYWLAPVDQPKVASLIAGASRLEIILDPLGAKTPIAFSLSGSSATLARTLKCMGSKELQSKEFSDALNVATEFPSQLPGNVGGAQVLPIVQEAFAFFVQGKSVAAQLAELRRSMKSSIEKEEKALGALAWAREDLRKSEAQLKVLRNERSVVSMRLEELRVERETLKTQKTAAEDEVSRKRTIHDRAKAELDPLLRSMVKERGELNAVNAEIAMNENRIRTSESQIQGLRAELSRLSNSISATNAKISAVEREKSAVDRRYRSYDVTSEARRILNSDYRYQNAVQSLRRAENDLRDAERDYRNSSQDADRASRELAQCRNQRNSNGGDQSSNSKANCSSEENQLQRAQSEKHRADRRIDQERSRIRQNEFVIRQSENDARREAQVEYDRLSREHQALERELRQLESRRLDDEARRRQVTYTEIPQREAAINSARSALQGLRYRQPTEQMEYTRAYEAWKKAYDRLDFERAEKELSSAIAALTTVESKLAKNASDTSSKTKENARLKQAIAESEVANETKTAVRDQAQAAVSAIANELASVRIEEQKLASEVETAKAGVVAKRSVYQAMYEKLVEGL